MFGDINYPNLENGNVIESHKNQMMADIVCRFSPQIFLWIGLIILAAAAITANAFLTVRKLNRAKQTDQTISITD